MTGRYLRQACAHEQRAYELREDAEHSDLRYRTNALLDGARQNLIIAESYRDYAEHEEHA